MLTSRLGSDCQAVVRALSTNINVALRNALQAIGEDNRNQEPPMQLQLEGLIA